MARIPAHASSVDSLDDPRVDAFGMLVETHNELTAAITKRLAATDAPPVPWLGVLLRLARTPGQRLRMSALARDMTMSTSGLTRLIDRVEAAGHVERERCPEDRRGLWASLTPEGLAVVMAAVPGHIDDLDDLFTAALSADELLAMTDLLRRVRDHVRGFASHPG